MSPKPPQQHRRPSVAPKSTRQQFSACGACRMRRVRCDLKDLPPEATTCSNCAERRLSCVDEFATVKTVKLLRRGRRLQQVEAVYGKARDDDRRLHSPAPCVPPLHPRFLLSPFYQRLHVQRPVLDTQAFALRYAQFCNGDHAALDVSGQLIAKVLVAWAASYGVDEYGDEILDEGPNAVQNRKDSTNAMVREILDMIDLHGLLRKPSWDSVRVLLLVMPLTEEVSEPLSRLSMYETAVNQVYTLCSIASVHAKSSDGQGDFVDALVRARIFWPLPIQLRTDNALANFHGPSAPLRLPAAPEVPIPIPLPHPPRWASAPLRLAGACRGMYTALVSASAVDVLRVAEAWAAMEGCWEDFESAVADDAPCDPAVLQGEDAKRFVDGWKIFLFECYNVVREALKEKLQVVPGGSAPASGSLQKLYCTADGRCRALARPVVELVRAHLGTSFFAYDAALVRDGCFFAGMAVAAEGLEEEMIVCLKALGKMRWAFSKNDERSHAIRIVWENRTGAAVEGCGPPGVPLAALPPIDTTGAKHERSPPPPPPPLPQQPSLSPSVLQCFDASPGSTSSGSSSPVFDTPFGAVPMAYAVPDDERGFGTAASGPYAPPFDFKVRSGGTGEGLPAPPPSFVVSDGSFLYS